MKLTDKFFFYAAGAMAVLTVLAAKLGAPAITVFVLAVLALLPLAKLVGEATEELSAHTNAAVGGFLNIAFGNAPELIIGLFALHAGLLTLVRASIAGAIMSNLLLVLGSALLVGGIRHKRQTFNKTAALASSTTLMLAVVALIMPAVFAHTSLAITAATLTNLNDIVAVFLLVVYVSYLWFMLKTHTHLYTEEAGTYLPLWSKAKSIGVLGGATLLMMGVSDVLVNTLEPTLRTLGWTQLFVGVVIVAIVGNAAEYVSALMMARKNKMDLALQIATGSATQITMFVAPILVIASLLFGQHLSLIFNTFELVAIVASVIITLIVVQDGESNWLEGMQLLVAYAIMVVTFFFYR